MSCHHTIHSSLPPSFASFPKSNNFQTRNLPPTDYNVNRTTQIPTEQIVRTLSVGCASAMFLILFVLPGILALCDRVIVRKTKG